MNRAFRPRPRPEALFDKNEPVLDDEAIRFIIPPWTRVDCKFFVKHIRAKTLYCLLLLRW